MFFAPAELIAYDSPETVANMLEEWKLDLVPYRNESQASWRDKVKTGAKKQDGSSPTDACFAVAVLRLPRR